jgi:hypothetical protein
MGLTAPNGFMVANPKTLRVANLKTINFPLYFTMVLRLPTLKP